MPHSWPRACRQPSLSFKGATMLQCNIPPRGERGREKAGDSMARRRIRAVRNVRAPLEIEPPPPPLLFLLLLLFPP